GHDPRGERLRWDRRAGRQAAHVRDGRRAGEPLQGQLLERGQRVVDVVRRVHVRPRLRPEVEGDDVHAVAGDGERRLQPHLGIAGVDGHPRADPHRKVDDHLTPCASARTLSRSTIGGTEVSTTRTRRGPAGPYAARGSGKIRSSARYSAAGRTRASGSEMSTPPASSPNGPTNWPGMLVKRSAITAETIQADMLRQFQPWVNQ